jgi:hypothetical protein
LCEAAIVLVSERTNKRHLHQEEEMKIPWKDANEGLPVSEEQYQEKFWRRRLDGIMELDWTRQLKSVPSHRIQASARCEMQLRGKGNSS